jgi:Fe-S-cluster-containing dehydrogenase component/DMSO reductase anchor subunit
MNQTPIESFIDYKADIGMQCGNYQIDIPELKEGEQYRFHFDMSLCVGCHCCEVACNEQNNNPADIKWRRVGEMESGVFPDMSQLFNSMSCNHCIDPECLKGCPTNSYIKFENGIVYHDDDLCIGCQYCTWNCPYEVPIFNPDRGIVTKCHMCHEKLDEGQTPACVQACPAGAIEIEAVNVKEWLDEGMAKEGVAPHLPDISITKPTTRYTLGSFDKNDIKPADKHILKPAHAELPLVFMTVLTQISVGGFLALFLGTVLNYFGFNLQAPNFWLALAVFLPAALGLPLSALHLGRPILAITAMKNIKTSWLSREAAALGLYALGASVIVGLYLLKVDGFVMVMLQALVLVVGVFGIHAQAMIYRIKARPSWDRNSTNKKFFGAGYVGFLITAFMMLLNHSDRSVMAILSLTLLFGAYQMFVIYEENTFYKYLQEDNKNYYQLSRTKKLLEVRFAKMKKARLISLFLFAIIFPLLAIIITASGALDVASIVLGISIVGAFVSEIMGRYLFFRSVVPLGLAGNFFAGSQRG